MVESTFNGAFYLEDGGLHVRCRGVETRAGVRWWHVMLGREEVAVSGKDILRIRRLFFAPTALVMRAYLPLLDQDEDEARGHVVHLWWAVDGKDGIPDVESWEDSPMLAPERAQTAED